MDEVFVIDYKSITMLLIFSVDVLSWGIRMDNLPQMILRDRTHNILTISTACTVLTPKGRAQLSGISVVLFCEGRLPCSVVGF